MNTKMKNQIAEIKSGKYFSELEDILEKIEMCYIVEYVQYDSFYSKFEIKYKTNLQVCEEIFDYDLEDWNENSPESFIVDGNIEIECLNNKKGELKIDEKFSNVFIYDCLEMQNSYTHFEGYQLDNLISGDNLLEYLKELLATFELVKGDEVFDKIDAVFFTETDKDLFNNEYLFIGKKTTPLHEQYFYKIEDNSQQNTNLVGREYWKKIDTDFFDVRSNGCMKQFTDVNGIEISIYEYFKPFLKTQKHIELLESLKEQS